MATRSLQKTKTGPDPGQKRRRRGRPGAQDPSGAELREIIIAAAATTYASHGYHGSSVAQILLAARVSRPTFYKYFKDRREVLDVVIARANDALREIVVEMTRAADSLEAVVESSIDAYFEWGTRIGPLVRPIYEEIHDTQSPASFHRGRVIGELTGLFQNFMISIGWPKLDSAMYDTMLHVIERIGHQAFWPERETEEAISRRRLLIARILIASLARPEDQNEIPSLAGLIVN